MRSRLLNLGFIDIGGNRYECELFTVEIDVITQTIYKLHYDSKGNITYTITTLEEIERELYA